MSLRRVRVVGALAVLAAALTLGLASEGAAQVGTTFTVNTVDNTQDNVCNAAHCSLLDAWYESEHHDGPDTIAFDIPGSAPHVIELPTTLRFSQPVDILGPDSASGHPTIVIDGTGNVSDELLLNGGHSTVRSLVIHGNGGYAISLDENADPVNGGHNFIQGNIIGLDDTGTQVVPTGGGVVQPPSRTVCGCEGGPVNIIGGTDPADRNVIVAEAASSIDLHSSDNTVQGNFIGTNATGTVAFPTPKGGVSLRSSN
jgi:hypothetical protein